MSVRKECAAFSSHPELLSLLPYVESLEDNEAITASGLCTYSIIHDLKNKAVFDAAGQQTATKATTATSTTPLQQVTFTIFPRWPMGGGREKETNVNPPKSRVSLSHSSDRAGSRLVYLLTL